MDKESKKGTVVSEDSAYYFRIARRMRVIMVGLILCLAVFVVAMFSLNREEITVENLKYFLRYIDTRQAEKSAATDTIVYDEIDSILRFGVYKNALVAVGYDQVQVYDLTGEAIMDINQVNSTPILLTGDKYMMVYNLGGMTFQLYSSIAKEYEESFPYGIGVAALGDTGRFLVSTRTMEYRSVVYVYDKDFEQIYRWYTPDKLVMDAAFRPGDKEFIIAALGTDETGTGYAEIILCETDREEKRAQFRIPDEVIYSARYTEDGGYVLVGGKAVYYYDREHTLVGTVSYNGYTPTYVYTNGEQTVITINENIVGSNYRVIVTDAVGETVYDGTVSGEITEILLEEDALYLLMDRSLMRVSLETGNQISGEITANAISVLRLDADTLLLCYAKETRVIDIDTFFFGEKMDQPR